jgi:hypothetical protein
MRIDICIFAGAPINVCNRGVVSHTRVRCRQVLAMLTCVCSMLICDGQTIPSSPTSLINNPNATLTEDTSVLRTAGVSIRVVWNKPIVDTVDWSAVFETTGAVQIGLAVVVPSLEHNVSV